MSDTMVQPGLQLGDDSGPALPAAQPLNKKLIIGGVAAAGLVGIFLYARSKKTAAATTAPATTGTPTVIYPGDTSGTGGQNYYDSLLAGLQNSGSATSTQLANLQQALESAVTAQSTGGSTTTGTTPAGTPPTGTTPNGSTQVANGGTGQVGPEVNPPFNPGVNPFGLGAGGLPGDTLVTSDGTFQPYLGSLQHGAPVGAITGYQDTGNLTTAGVVIGPGEEQSYNTQTGQAVGSPFYTPSAAGYITGTKLSGVTEAQAGQYIAANAGSNGNGLVTSYDPNSKTWAVVQEIANQTGGYG